MAMAQFCRIVILILIATSVSGVLVEQETARAVDATMQFNSGYWDIPLSTLMTCRSRLDCVRVCLENLDCALVSYHPGQKRCLLSSTANGLVIDPAWKTYSVRPEIIYDILVLDGRPDYPVPSVLRVYTTEIYVDPTVHINTAKILGTLEQNDSPDNVYMPPDGIQDGTAVVALSDWCVYIEAIQPHVWKAERCDDKRYYICLLVETVV